MCDTFVVVFFDIHSYIHKKKLKINMKYEKVTHPEGFFCCFFYSYFNFCSQYILSVIFSGWCFKVFLCMPQQFILTIFTKYKKF